MPLERITIFCFAASYAVALGLELLGLLRPRPILRLLGTAFSAAGLLAHTLYFLVQRPPLASQFGSLLFLSWILAVFYLYGSIHHRHLAWGAFVLPVVLGLVVLAALFPHVESATGELAFSGESLWGRVHGGLLLLAAVGICVAFVASVMYLLQARQLRDKVLPGRGLKLFSLERLEQMNRRAINLAFPLLTVGVLVGIVLLAQHPEQVHGWLDPKVISTGVLWVVFAVLLYLRYGVHLRGSRLAVLTIVAFALLLVTLASSHAVVQGGVP
jgi:ABC-type transport system involved in cytochrome c biogenesis permease subunit